MYGSAPSLFFSPAGRAISGRVLQSAAMSKGRCSAFHEDTIERLLDRVSYMCEELIAIERSLERMQIAKLTQNGDKRGPTHFPNSKAETSNSRTVRVVS